MPTHSNGLALFFTLGVSLQSWLEGGFLERELAYYRRLGEALGGVTWVTYGGQEDARLAATLDGVRVLNNAHNLAPHDYARRAASLHGDALRGVAVVKTNQIKGAEAARRASRLTGAKLVTRGGYVPSRFYGSQGISARQRFGRWRREWLAFWSAARVMLPTPGDVAYVRRTYGLPARRMALIPNFVMTDLFKPDPSVAPQPGLIGFVGRLAPQKNLAELVEAVGGLDGARLRLIGDGPEGDTLAAQARQAGVTLECTGRVPHADLPHLLAECEVFVLPSLFEGHPKTLIEAMACGLPVLGTPVRGTLDVIADGTNGLLAPDTSAEGLRVALGRLLDDADLRARLGGEARRYALAHYSMEVVLDQELEVYRQLGVLVRQA